MSRGTLLTTDSTKINKSVTYGYYTTIMYLSPHSSGGGSTLCAGSTSGCRASCLVGSGKMRFPGAYRARWERTQLWLNERALFWRQLEDEIDVHINLAQSHGLLPCVRLNGTSDIPWERFRAGRRLFELFQDVQFYDYTKLSVRRDLPANYHLTLSRSESNEGDCQRFLARGGNVAVVFDGPLPRTYWGYQVVDGDRHDLRFLDPHPRVIGLSVKGSVDDSTGFVVSGKENTL